MGCDIHCVLERKWNGKWIGVNPYASHDRATWTLRNETDSGFSSPVVRDRNYHRFARLAGVRINDEKISECMKPKGVPKNASQLTKYLVGRWGVDGHSHSWLPLTEAVKIWAETEWRGDKPRNKREEFSQTYPAYYFFGVEPEIDDIEDYRVIFWFDN